VNYSHPRVAFLLAGTHGQPFVLLTKETNMANDFVIRGSADDNPEIDRPHGGRHDGCMEARISALESANLETRDRLARIETRLEAVATKSDLHRELAGQTWRFLTWTTTIGIALIGATFAIAKLVH
jgi:hypothetical protein